MSRSAARTWLEQARTPAGAWGYRVGEPPAPEPTLLAAAAGAPVAGAWLAEAELGWTALLLPAALLGRPEGQALRRAALDRLQAWEPGVVPITAGSFDGTLRGWSWVPRTFTWVEPTLWAVLSLWGGQRTDGPRYAEGLAVLADRQGVDGGWNAGNPDILGTDLPSYHYLTGLVLLALPPGHPSVPAALAFLGGVSEQPSVYALSAAILGGAAHGRAVDAWAEDLRARQAPDGAFDGRVDRTALALCALAVAAGEPCPFVGTPAEAP